MRRPDLSTSWAVVRAPRITEVTAGCAASHASETCAWLAPLAIAISSTTVRMRHVRSCLLRGAHASIPRSGSSPRRVAPVGSASRWYLPVSQPPANGDQGSRPMFASRQAGTISDSISRTSRLYCGWRVTGGVKLQARATCTALVSCQPR
jgi:hypothetical protein